MDPDESKFKRSKGFALGDSLELFSIAELEELLTALGDERDRVKSELSRKRAQASAAESLFRSPDQN